LLPALASVRIPTLVICIGHGRSVDRRTQRDACSLRIRSGARFYMPAGGTMAELAGAVDATEPEAFRRSLDGKGMYRIVHDRQR
jgi:hypothetical protein